MDFAETRNSIDIAEKAFVEGDFVRATKEAMRVLDSYK